MLFGGYVLLILTVIRFLELKGTRPDGFLLGRLGFDFDLLE
jgi:hypothetical protein